MDLRAGHALHREIGGHFHVELAGVADGRAGRPPYFTNYVHKDHIHVGFETG